MIFRSDFQKSANCLQIRRLYSLNFFRLSCSQARTYRKTLRSQARSHTHGFRRSRRSCQSSRHTCRRNLVSLVRRPRVRLLVSQARRQASHLARSTRPDPRAARAPRRAKLRQVSHDYPTSQARATCDLSGVSRKSGRDRNSGD